MNKPFRRTVLTALGASLLLTSNALAEPPLSTGVPAPGRSIASDDDATATLVNPASLAFMPGAELCWTWARTGGSSTDPGRGHAVDAAVPFSMLATGLRMDFIDPPDGAPSPFDEPLRWTRWSLALRAKEAAALGFTFAWSSAETPYLDGAFSLTAGTVVRPFPFLSFAAVARDLNIPETRSHIEGGRSFEGGLTLRPINGRRGLEIGLETAFRTQGDEWVPKATVGIDVPRVGRLRGEVSAHDVDGDRALIAMAGLDVNIGAFQLSGGGIFGDAITRSGTGFYAGAAVRAFREPGVVLPAKFLRIEINSTPGVRGHVHLLQRLWSIANDPEAAGVLFVLRDEPSSSMAHGEELGDAIRALRAAGKKVVCHLEDAKGQSLFVCSQADRTVMNPAGGLRFSGLSSRYFYFGGALDKLGVKADFVRIGDHKLAAEQFTNQRGSDVATKDHQSLVDEYEKIFLHDVGGGRRIAMDDLKKRIAKGPFLASEARAEGLIDGLAFEDELPRVLEEVMGEPVKLIDDERPPRAPDRFGNLPKIAVIYLAGDMVDGESQSFPFVGIRLAGSRTIGDALRRAREDKTVRAVVFRVETGGGSSLAADVILREAILTAEKKPFIVSMGTAAASGGYYASVAGQTIFANRTTLTGSIGIFYGKVDFSGLLGSFGVGTEGFRSAPRADAESFFRPFTDDERRELGVKVKQFYDLFIGRVSEGRNMRPEAVDAVARGKVWLGAQAQTRGLVDSLGGIRLALAEARARGGLPTDAPIVEWPEENDSLLGLIMDAAGAPSASAQTAMIPDSLKSAVRAVAPFMIYEPGEPLAHSEWFEDESFGGAHAGAEP